MNTATKPRSVLEALCEEQGLLLLGVVPLQYPAEYERFEAWLAERRHAGLQYLEQHSDIRAHPERLLPGARAAISLALPYSLPAGDHPHGVAQYACYDDYHRVLRRKAHAIAEAFVNGPFRVVVDTAPVLERALASKTARGFIGKNTLYIHPDHGSYLLLGEIVTTDPLGFDDPPTISLSRKTKEGGCGPCRMCQSACPTGALDREYSLDAALCLSYWTIEQRGPIPERFWPWLGETYFGCDRCQTVCPYNKRAKPAPADWRRREYPSLDAIAVMSQAEYERYFGGSPLTRAKRAGLRRNALIALAVTAHSNLDGVLDFMEKETDLDPVLRQTVQQVHQWRAKHD